MKLKEALSRYATSFGKFESRNPSRYARNLFSPCRAENTTKEAIVEEKKALRKLREITRAPTTTTTLLCLSKPRKQEVQQLLSSPSQGLGSLER
ncbi:hypothetical protein E3N88_14685 [Mikania micrantha]|uniref:Uncharacterized protein n=1 Tax=Mikania micrantha TaxID=192012 RepID=A0A5N6P569_9ASTR|nr:hypothetical protein E3N88_14685 [Mikania micrantha]